MGDGEPKYLNSPETPLFQKRRNLYGLAEAAEEDPLLSQIPAVEQGAIAMLPNSTPLAAAANPTPLSITYNLDEYLDLLAAALA